MATAAAIQFFAIVAIEGRARREKQIQKVISNTSGMYGDFQGLIGSSLQTIPALTAKDDILTDEASSAQSELDDEIPF